MAFLPSSRYSNLPTVDVPAPGSRTTTVVKLRRLPTTPGTETVVAFHDRLDVLAHEQFGDSTAFWHIADANTELVADDLVVPGRVIQVPAK